MTGACGCDKFPLSKGGSAEARGLSLEARRLGGAI